MTRLTRPKSDPDQLHDQTPRVLTPSDSFRSRDLRQRKIPINAISAGVIPTSGYKAAGLTEAQFDQFVQGAISNIPLGRAGTVEEVAKAYFSWHRTTAVMSTASSCSWTAGMAQI